MRVLLATTLLGLGLSQTLSATGAVDFGTDSAWAGGASPLTPSLATDLTIATDAQVTVSSSPGVTLKPLTLGSLATNTTLILGSGVTFAVPGLTWANGQIDMGANAVFRLDGAATLTAGATATTRRIIGATGSALQLGIVGLSRSVTVNGGLDVNSVTVEGNGGSFILNNGATLQFSGTNVVNSATTITGTGGSLQVSGSTTVHGGSLSVDNAAITGELTADTASAPININGAVTVTGSGSVGGNFAQVNVKGSLSVGAGTVVPGGTFNVVGTVTIASGASAVTVTNPLTFNGAGSLTVSGTLNAGIDTTIGVATTVGGTLTVGDGSSAVEVSTKPGTVLTVSGGTLNVQSNSDLFVGANQGGSALSTVRFSGDSTLQRGEVKLSVHGALEVSDGVTTVTNDANITGFGTAVVKAGAELRANAKVWISAPTTSVGGNLSLGSSGDVTVATDSTVDVSGGKLLGVSGGKLSISSGATLQFSGTAESSIQGPRIDVDGTVFVVAGAQATVEYATGTTIRGNGNFTCAGHFRLEAAADVRPELKVIGPTGLVSVAAMVQADFTSVNLGAGAKARLEFTSDGGFTTVHVNDTLALAGSLEVLVPGKEPANVVILIKAGQITGSFSATSVVAVSGGRRLLASGTVVTNGDNVEYHPGTSANSATKTGCFFGLLVLMGMFA